MILTIGGLAACFRSWHNERQSMRTRRQNALLTCQYLSTENFVSVNGSAV